MFGQYKPLGPQQRSQASTNPPSHAYRPSHQKNTSSPSLKNPNSQTSSASKLQQNNRSNGIVEPQRRELLVMTIDLGNGGKDLLRVFEGEDPFQLAMDFCEKHKLDPKLVEPLAQNIYGNMEQVLQESVETLNMCGPNSQRGVGVPKDDDPDTMSSRRYRTDEQIFPETTNSREFTEEEGVYQMLNHADNMDAPMIAERVGMMNQKNYDSPGKNGDFRQDARSSGNKGSPVYERIQNHSEERQVKSALLSNSGNGKKVVYSNSPYSGQEVRRSSGPTVEFQNEQYDSNNSRGYELTLTPNNSQNNQELYNKLARPANVQTSDLKQEPTMNKSMSSTLNNSSAPLINYGILLYHRGLQKNEETKKQMADQRKQKLELKTKECTFKPELNSLSKQIVSTKARMENVPEMLITAGKNKQAKLERVRSAQKAKELEECTFKPETNIISDKIDQQKSQMSINVDQDRCLRLFQEAKGRKDQREYISNTLSPEYTFKPATIQYKEGSVAQTTFEERDRKFKERLDRVNYMRQLKEQAEVFDPETGEELFKPKIGRAPKQGRNAANLPIGEHLYNQHLKSAEDKKKQNAYYEKSVQSTMMVRSNEKSQALVEDRLKRRLEDIFRRLDSDGDGVISSSKIDITKVEIEILETLAPILCEMEEKNQALDFDTFYELTERLLKLLSVPEKDQLLLGKRGPVEEPQYTFQPAIDKKSEKLAQKKHPYGHFASLYSSYTDERKKLEQKIQNEKSKKVEDELKECSFKPTFFTKGNQGSQGTKSVKNSTSFGNNYFMDDLLL